MKIGTIVKLADDSYHPLKDNEEKGFYGLHPWKITDIEPKWRFFNSSNVGTPFKGKLSYNFKCRPIHFYLYGVSQNATKS